MTKWECMVCGYVYDPAKGDPDNGVAPGTPFEKLPDDWVCPECGADKSMFQQARPNSHSACTGLDGLCRAHCSRFVSGKEGKRSSCTYNI